MSRLSTLIPAQPWRVRLAVAATGLATIALLITLWAALPPETFFSGDAGIKLGQIESLLDNGFTDVRLPYLGQDVDPNSKISPYRLEPSVYIKDGGNYSVFPVAFPALSAPAYRAFGARGLYLLPLLGAAVCFVATYGLARLVVGRVASLVAAVAALLATPLGFYALTFWEHVPAVAMVLLALWLFLRDRTNWRTSLGAGLLMGASAWLRIEIIILAALVGAAGLAMRDHRRQTLVFGVGVAVMVLALLLFNRQVYGEWLAHASLNQEYALQATQGASESRLTWLRRSLLGLHEPVQLPPGASEGPAVLSRLKEDLPRQLIVGIMLGLAIALSWPARMLAARHATLSRGLIMVQFGLLAGVGAVTIGHLWAVRHDEAPLASVIYSGGLLTFAPWLGLVLLVRPDWCPAPEKRRWLTVIVVAGGCFALITAVVAPNDGGLRHGPRYLLPAVPLLAIAALAAVESWSARYPGRLGRGLPWVLLGFLVLAALLVNARGYEILRHKKLLHRDLAEEMLEPVEARIAADQGPVAFNLMGALTARRLHWVNTPANFAELVRRARGVGDRWLVYGIFGREAQPPVAPERLGIKLVKRRIIRGPVDRAFVFTVFKFQLDDGAP